MPINFDSVFGIHEKAMLLRAERAGILANNLANADTPNFKARDINFKAELNRADQALQASKLKRTHARHLSAAGAGFSSAEKLYRVPLQPSIDGNTVDSQVEQAAFAKNAMAYQASLRFMSGRVKGMLAAIRGE